MRYVLKYYMLTYKNILPLLILLLVLTRVVTALILSPWWAVPVIWRFTAIFFQYRLPPKCYHRKMKNCLPPIAAVLH